jgi:GxxExxY protein
MTVTYRGVDVGAYRADLVVDGKVIIEGKVADKIVRGHELQLLNYLRATGLTVGMILNFGPEAIFRRLLLTSPKEGSVFIRS